MDKINYLSNSQATQSGKYPVTIQGLDFIQKQILQLQTLAFVGGDYYILKPSSSTKTGVCVINGEVLPLSGGTSATDTHICITTMSETIRTDSGDYEDVREIRVAKYGKHTSGATYKDAAWTPLTAFADFAPNTELLARINELTALMGGSGFLPIKTGVYSLAALKDEKSPARIFCKAGSVSVGGYNVYTVDVYACGGGVTYQELKTPDFRQYGRYFNPVTGLWGDFQLLDEQMQVEAKVIRGCLYLRHGFLPSYARIVVLRKKRRGRQTGLNRKNRSVKNAWCHGYRLVFSTGKANMWYVPKCLEADTAGKYVIGQEFAAVIDQLLYKPATSKHPYWSISGVNKKWNSRLIRRAYAKLSVAVITSKTHSVPASSMLRLKYRVWQDKNSVIKRCLSVE